MRRKITVEGKPATMGELRAFVIDRDGRCLGWVYDSTHACHDKWGRPHHPYDRPRLTLEHVPGVHSHLEGRVDDERHCVTLCHGLNTLPPPAELRNWMRMLLRKWYPECDPEQEE